MGAAGKRILDRFGRRILNPAGKRRLSSESSNRTECCDGINCGTCEGMGPCLKLTPSGIDLSTLTNYSIYAFFGAIFVSPLEPDTGGPNAPVRSTFDFSQIAVSATWNAITLPTCSSAADCWATLCPDDHSQALIDTFGVTFSVDCPIAYITEVDVTPFHPYRTWVTLDYFAAHYVSPPTTADELINPRSGRPVVDEIADAFRIIEAEVRWTLEISPFPENKIRVTGGIGITVDGITEAEPLSPTDPIVFDVFAPPALIFDSGWVELASCFEPDSTDTQTLSNTLALGGYVLVEVGNPDEFTQCLLAADTCFYKWHGTRNCCNPSSPNITWSGVSACTRRRKNTSIWVPTGANDPDTGCPIYEIWTQGEPCEEGECPDPSEGDAPTVSLPGDANCCPYCYIKYKLEIDCADVDEIHGEDGSITYVPKRNISIIDTVCQHDPPDTLDEWLYPGEFSANGCDIQYYWQRGPHCCIEDGCIVVPPREEWPNPPEPPRLCCSHGEPTVQFLGVNSCGALQQVGGGNNCPVYIVSPAPMDETTTTGGLSSTETGFSGGPTVWTKLLTDHAITTTGHRSTGEEFEYTSYPTLTVTVSDCEAFVTVKFHDDVSGKDLILFSGGGSVSPGDENLGPGGSGPDNRILNTIDCDACAINLCAGGRAIVTLPRCTE